MTTPDVSGQTSFPEVPRSDGAWRAPSPVPPASSETSTSGSLPDPLPMAAPTGPPVRPPFGPAVPAAASAPPPRPRSVWRPVVAAAAGAAILASAGTAGLVTAFGTGSQPTATATVTAQAKAPEVTAPVSSSTSTNPDWEKVAAAVRASVVAIDVNTFSGEAQGSGVVIDAAGHVLTNNHVVSEATGGTVDVSLADGRLYTATVVGQDAATDLAVLALQNPPTDLSPAVLGDSSTVVVGEPVMAVGNPLGLDNTVTVGIVSAVDRPVGSSSQQTSTPVVTNAIQIDAAINPGNSGGPLFDAQGRVIGITSSIATLTGSSQSGSIGLGFAIPVNVVQSIASQLISSGRAQHAYLGVSLSDGTATSDGTTRRGAVVQQVGSGSPADTAGLKVSDVIVAIDGAPVSGAESLTAAVRARTANQSVELTVVRDGATSRLTATLAAKADNL